MNGRSTMVKVRNILAATLAAKYFFLSTLSNQIS